ncbi:MAG: TraR/DksA family transcriptional regulator [Candidatus Neomarinimicrobiota bacterium]|nr:MAG: TraR/DksA family transcriptional regulator [Candidatus Neomarinimicrobiota bacterium]
MKAKYTKAELNRFKNLILKKMEEVTREVNDIQSGITNSDAAKSGTSPDSIYSVHMADAGTDSHEREKNYLFMTRENNYLQNLETALDRIEDGSFGICKICGKLIEEERMMEVPNTTKHVECKEREKLGLI